MFVVLLGGSSVRGLATSVVLLGGSSVCGLARRVISVVLLFLLEIFTPCC